MAKISDGIAILDSIASRNFGYSPDVMGFDMFNVDMAEAMVDSPEEGITFAAMVRESRTKESEYRLWSLKNKPQAKLASDKPDLSADYANNAEYACDYNPISLAMGLIEAFKNNPEEGGLTVAELFDITPDMFAGDSDNTMSNRKTARKHDRSRRKAND